MYSITRSLVFASTVAAASAESQLCEWAALDRGLDDSVHALAVFDDGRGSALYAGGAFQAAGGQSAHRVARWDGEAWSPVGAGFQSGLVFDLAVFDDGRGGGPGLYAGGSFETSGVKSVRGIAKWDGASWSEIGGGIAGGATKPKVEALAVFDDGRGAALYAGGSFASAGGVPGTSFIARWDGKSWTPVGGGVSSYVRGLAVYDDGTGPALYATGHLASAGGPPVSYIARWDGVSWSPLGDGLDSWGYSLGVFDDGSGPALYVGGPFTAAGGSPASQVAKWNGAVWSQVGEGVGDGIPWSFAVFDEGRGPALYVGGGFSVAGQTPAGGIARWNGKEWSTLGSGFGDSSTPGAYALAEFDDGAGSALYAGGTFRSAGGISASYIARWRCEPTPCPPDCDTSGDLTFFDFLCFQSHFAAADPRADCDGDTHFTFFDFLCFQNAFAAGCP